MNHKQFLAKQFQTFTTADQAGRMVEDLNDLLDSKNWLHILEPLWPDLNEQTPLGKLIDPRWIVDFFEERAMPSVLSLLPGEILEWVEDHSTGRHSHIVRKFVSGTKGRIGKLCFDFWLEHLDKCDQELLLLGKNQAKRVTKEYSRTISQLKNLKMDLDSLQKQRYRLQADALDLEQRLTKTKETLDRTEADLIAACELISELAKDVKRQETEMTSGLYR